MSKFDIMKERQKLARKLAGVDLNEANMNTLKSNDKQRRYRNARDDKLFKFGSDLFNNGYSLDDFKARIILAVVNKDIDLIELFQYDFIEDIPLDRIMNIIKETKIISNVNKSHDNTSKMSLGDMAIEFGDFIFAVENGYAVASRIAYAKNKVSNAKNK